MKTFIQHHMTHMNHRGINTYRISTFCVFNGCQFRKKHPTDAEQQSLPIMTLKVRCTIGKKQKMVQIFWGTEY